MGVIRCDTCERTVDLDYDATPICNESTNKWTCGICQEDALIDRWGNPIDGSRLIYCCFPDCGCDGARLCMAEEGAHEGALALNLEKRNRKS